MSAGTACSPSGGGSGRFRLDVFPLDFLPLALPVAGDSASLDFDGDGDLLAVAGTGALFRVSRADGSLEETDVGADADCTGVELTAVLADPRAKAIWLGAADGRVLALDEAGDCTEVADLGGEPVTGLVLAPRRVALPRGALVAAAGSDGVFVVDVTVDPPFPSTRLTPDAPNAYVDVAFFESLLLALDTTAGEVVALALDEDGGEAELSTLFDDLAGAVGIEVEERFSDLVIVDAGEGALRSVPLLVDDAEIADVAPYTFGAAPPGGLAFDGSGTVAFATAGSVVLRAARLPGIAAGAGALIEGPNVGYGDLELDANGDFLLVANVDDAFPDDDGAFPSPDNFLLRLERDAEEAVELASGVGTPGELLLSLARDPGTGDLYLGSDLGNVFRRSSNSEAVELADLGSAVLGLEWAPPASELAGQLVATTEDGDVVAVDPVGGAQTPLDVLPLPLPDLVFGSDGTLYVVARNADGPSSIWSRPDGGVFGILVEDAALRLPDGIALDEGGERLLVASDVDAETDQLLEVPLAGGAVRALADIDIDDGFFPSGVVYDGLGRAAVRASDLGTAVDGFEVPFPL